ncbi:MAG: hypothetical protein U0798_12140 [Gemmataceae bacterium]
MPPRALLLSRASGLRHLTLVKRAAAAGAMAKPGSFGAAGSA